MLGKVPSLVRPEKWRNTPNICWCTDAGDNRGLSGAEGGERGKFAGNNCVKEVKWMLVGFSWHIEVTVKL